jgi:putative salt-induced outer membrane protein YdiY
MPCQFVSSRILRVRRAARVAAPGAARSGRFGLAAVGLALGLVLAPAAASADEVILTDGTRLVGTVEGLSDGKLRIKTDFAGALVIDAAKIKGMSIDRPLMVQTKDGQRALEQLRYRPQDGQRAMGGPPGERALEMGQVTAIWSPDREAPDIEKARARWKVRLEGGLDGQTGNSERFSGNGRITVDREAPGDRLKIYGLARYSRENGEESAKEFIGGSVLEVDLSERLFAYGRVELENDKFEDIDLRAQASAGLGYFVIRKPTQEMKIRGGLGYRHETYRDSTSDDSMVGEAGLDYRIDLAPWLAYRHGSIVSVPVDDVNDVLFTMENGLEVPLGKDSPWKIRLGMRNQYDAEPQPGFDRLDTYYFLNLVLDWK